MSSCSMSNVIILSVLYMYTVLCECVEWKTCYMERCCSHSVLSSMSRKTWVRVFQVTGCLPLPATHSSMISILISFESLLCLWARWRILAPLWSFSRRPNSRYLTPISWGMLILAFLPRNLMHSIRVGWWTWSSIGWRDWSYQKLMKDLDIVFVFSTAS